MIERITLQWLAGFFDGEGSVACYQTKAPPSKWTGKVHIRWKIKVSLTQNDEGLLKAICSKFPEFEFCQPSLKTSSTSTYEITAEGGNCRMFLEAMRPLVIRKLLDVETGLEFCETIQKFRKGKKRLELTQAERDIRITLIEKMKAGREKDSIN